MKKKHRRQNSKHSPLSQYVKCSLELVRCGKALSAKAFRLFLTLSSYSNGYHPGIRRLSELTGMGTETVRRAIEELEKKGMIFKLSGQKEYCRNQYHVHAPSNWDKGVRQEAVRQASVRGSRLSISKLNAKRDRSVAKGATLTPSISGECSDSRHVSVAIVATESVAMVATVLDHGDQIIGSPLRRSSDAVSQRSANAVDPSGEPNGSHPKGGLTASTLSARKRETLKLAKALLEKQISPEDFQKQATELSEKYGHETFFVEPKKKKPLVVKESNSYA